MLILFITFYLFVLFYFTGILLIIAETLFFNKNMNKISFLNLFKRRLFYKYIFLMF